MVDLIWLTLAFWGGTGIFVSSNNVVKGLCVVSTIISLIGVYKSW